MQISQRPRHAKSMGLELEFVQMLGTRQPKRISRSRVTIRTGWVWPISVGRQPGMNCGGLGARNMHRVRLFCGCDNMSHGQSARGGIIIGAGSQPTWSQRGISRQICPATNAWKRCFASSSNHVNQRRNIFHTLFMMD